MQAKEHTCIKCVASADTADDFSLGDVDAWRADCFAVASESDGTFWMMNGGKFANTHRKKFLGGKFCKLIVEVFILQYGKARDDFGFRVVHNEIVEQRQTGPNVFLLRLGWYGAEFHAGFIAALSHSSEHTAPAVAGIHGCGNTRGSQIENLASIVGRQQLLRCQCVVGTGMEEESALTRSS